MEISGRIKKIIDSEGLTYSTFADMIGIQRSNVSHILNGRDGKPSNPSFEVLQKILTAFPRYNTDWLVMGRGEIYRQPVQTSIFDIIGDEDEKPTVSASGVTNGIDAASNTVRDELKPSSTDFSQAHAAENRLDTESSQSIDGDEEHDEPSNELSTVLAHAAQHQAEVKQVVVLYTDNTFVAYNKQ
jgi:transcriptional regulator with XRE-family HTH domain